MKDSGVEWIGEIPKDWDTRRLKVALYMVKEIVENYNEENILSLTMNGVIVRDLVNPKGKMPTTFDGYQKISKGNFITCLFDIDVTPRCVGIAYVDGLTSPAYTQFKINEKFDIRFVYYYLLMLDNDKIIVPLTKSLRNTIRSEDFLNLKFSFPNLESQIKISKALTDSINKINHIIFENQKSIDELKKYKQSIITEVVTKGLDPNVELKDSEIEWLGKIPIEWDVIPSNLLFFDSVKKVEGEVELLTASQKYGVISQRKFMELETQVPVQKRNLNDLKDVQKGDFVISLRSFQGGIEIAQESGGVTPAYTVLKQKKYDIHPEYYKYFLKSTMYIQALRSTVLDTIRDGKSIKFSHFSQVPLILPPFEKQVEIAKYLDSFNESIKKIIKDKNKLIKELEQYKKSLIYEYVTGKKEV